MTKVQQLPLSKRLVWWMLIAGIVLVITLGLTSLAGAGDENPPTTNSSEAQQSEATRVESLHDFPEPPPGQVWTVNEELIPIDDIGVEAPTAFEPASAETEHHGQARLFYLTDANYYTDQPLTACASGYHMASLWEILDPTNLVYDFNHPDAHTKTDSGQGPPSYWNGWVRTGQSASSSTTTGTGNCSAWTSRDSNERGVTVRLTRDWENPPGEVGGIWDATSFACSIPGPVWCVQD